MSSGRSSPSKTPPSRPGPSRADTGPPRETAGAPGPQAAGVLVGLHGDPLAVDRDHLTGQLAVPERDHVEHRRALEPSELDQRPGHPHHPRGHGRPQPLEVGPHPVQDPLGERGQRQHGPASAVLGHHAAVRGLRDPAPSPRPGPGPARRDAPAARGSRPASRRARAASCTRCRRSSYAWPRARSTTARACRRARARSATTSSSASFSPRARASRRIRSHSAAVRRRTASTFASASARTRSACRASASSAARTGASGSVARPRRRRPGRRSSGHHHRERRPGGVAVRAEDACRRRR